MILMQEEDEDVDEEMTLVTRNFKRFLKKNVVATPSRRQEEEIKETKRNLKIKEKKENTKDKIQCYKCKGYRYMMYESPINDMDQDHKGKKLLQAIMKLDDNGSEIAKVNFAS